MTTEKWVSLGELRAMLAALKIKAFDDITGPDELLVRVGYTRSKMPEESGFYFSLGLTIRPDHHGVPGLRGKSKQCDMGLHL